MSVLELLTLTVRGSNPGVALHVYKNVYVRWDVDGSDRPQWVRSRRLPLRECLDVSRSSNGGYEYEGS